MCLQCRVDMCAGKGSKLAIEGFQKLAKSAKAMQVAIQKAILGMSWRVVAVTGDVELPVRPWAPCHFKKRFPVPAQAKWLSGYKQMRSSLDTRSLTKHPCRDSRALQTLISEF